VLHEQDGRPAFQTGAADEQATLPVAGEVFLLRKMLPQTADYDFNVHVMDFLPGEFLNVKVRYVHACLDAAERVATSPSALLGACLRSLMLWYAVAEEPGSCVQEVHYNQHGLLLLQGQGIYRLADKWCAAASQPLRSALSLRAPAAASSVNVLTCCKKAQVPGAGR